MNSKQMLLQRQQTANLLLATLCGIILLLTTQPNKLGAEAKQVALVPLTAQKVYQLLNKNHNLEAIPEGRIVTQGIAAVTGFTLGLKKAVGAALLYDIITANITEDSTSNATNTEPLYSTQEICFTARNARSLDEAEAIAESYGRLEGTATDLYTAAVRKSGKKRLTKPTRHRKRKLKKVKANSRPQRIQVDNTMTMRPTTSANVAIQTSQPTATAAATAGVDETNINNGLNTETTSTTTTSTDNDKTVTCIVLQKPKLK